MLKLLTCLDSNAMARARRRELDISPSAAAALGRSAVEAATAGSYYDTAGARVDWSGQVQAARSAKISLPPEAPVPPRHHSAFPETRIQVANETTLGASLRLVENAQRPLALNFANGVSPGGGFLVGARAQEEVLSRSSALHATLVDDTMYGEHAARPLPDVFAAG